MKICIIAVGVWGSEAGISIITRSCLCNSSSCSGGWGRNTFCSSSWTRELIFSRFGDFSFSESGLGGLWY